MSRILKVLDQLEQEKSARLAPTGSDRLSGQPEAGATRSHPKPSCRQKRLTWLFAVVILAITAAFVWHPAAQFVDHPGPVLGREPSAARTTPLAGDSGGGTGVAQPGEPLPEKIDNASEVAAPPRFLNFPSVRSASSDRSEPVSTQPGSTAESGSPAYARVDRGRIRLQAIVWSPVASDRKAVVNEEIVCEGERVDGLTIVAINVEDVIFSHQGQLLRATLGH